ncbi:hypothetical protein ACQKM9_04120 [Viridibacillus sp. NPDC093762]|uniref:hypothetical protein n=1 Tax=Viridibacillus sp. NPDC093762 TaxID=3390720 RepID=UPI003D08F2AA
MDSYIGGRLRYSSQKARLIISGDKKIAVNKGNVIIWFVSVIVGLLFTSNPLFTAPFAKGIFKGNSLGWE